MDNFHDFLFSTLDTIALPKWGSTLKRKNLHQWEQILSFTGLPMAELLPLKKLTLWCSSNIHAYTSFPTSNAWLIISIFLVTIMLKCTQPVHLLILQLAWIVHTGFIINQQCSYKSDSSQN